MASIVNEGTKDYRVCRDTIYAGSVIKTKRVLTIDNKIYVPDYTKLRSTIFTINEDGLAQDLLYNAPNYPIRGISDSSKTNNDIIINNAFKMKPLLDLYGFCNLLYYIDIITAKNIFFSGSFVKHNLGLFGIDKEALLKCSALCTNGVNTSIEDRVHELIDYIYSVSDLEIRDEFDSDIKLSELIKKGRLSIDLIDLIDELVELNEIQKKQKSIFRKIDSFTPVKEEKNVKRLKPMF